MCARDGGGAGAREKKEIDREGRRESGGEGERLGGREGGRIYVHIHMHTYIIYTRVRSYL